MPICFEVDRFLFEVKMILFFFSIYKSHQNVIVSILVFETETSFLFVHAHGVKLPDATLSLVDSDAVTGCRLS